MNSDYQREPEPPGGRPNGALQDEAAAALSAAGDLLSLLLSFACSPV